MLPTVADVLRLEPVAEGLPTVIAGRDRLGNRVRWVHVSDLPDIARLLKGGELLLTVGAGLPDSEREQAAYVASLVRAGVSGLVIELGRKFQEPPPAIARAADLLHLPVIVLSRQVLFVSITEAAHGLIISHQLAELQAREQIHETFTELALEGASAADVVREAARMAGRAVLLENMAHEVLAHAADGVPAERLLRDWDARSRQVVWPTRTGLITAPERWLVTPVSARSELWGRLVMILLSEEEPAARFWTILERAAGTIAINRLADRDRETLERQAHSSLLAEILAASGGPSSELQSRARALGVPLRGRLLTGCLVTIPDAGLSGVLGEARHRERVEMVVAAVREAGVHALVGSLAGRSIGILVSSSGADTVECDLERAAEKVHAALGRAMDSVRLSAGSTVERLRDARRSFREAEQVSAAVRETDPKRLVYRLPDVRLRGLLHVLREDARVQTFFERELGELIAHDRATGGHLFEVLRAYLESGRHKAAAARALGISRPYFYQRLEELRDVLGVDLDSVESCLSLHVAMLGMQADNESRRAAHSSTAS